MFRANNLLHLAIHKLFKPYPVVPIASSGMVRSFSTFHRVKAWMRSTIAEDRCKLFAIDVEAKGTYKIILKDWSLSLLNHLLAVLLCVKLVLCELCIVFDRIKSLHICLHKKFNCFIIKNEFFLSHIFCDGSTYSKLLFRTSAFSGRAHPSLPLPPLIDH